MSDNWRVQVRLPERTLLDRARDRLEESRVSKEAQRLMGGRVVVTHDQATLFAYTETEAAAREARRLISEVLEKDDIEAEIALQRWHPDAEDWEAPEVEVEPAAEHARLQEREQAESRERGWPEWEVRVHCPDHHSAVEFAQRLDAEGLPVSRGWSVVILGAETEDDANALADRIRREAPAGAEVDAEGSRGYVEASAPFSWVANLPLGGGAS